MSSARLIWRIGRSGYSAEAGPEEVPAMAHRRESLAAQALSDRHFSNHPLVHKIRSGFPVCSEFRYQRQPLRVRFYLGPVLPKCLPVGELDDIADSAWFSAELGVPHADLTLEARVDLRRPRHHRHEVLKSARPNTPRRYDRYRCH